MTDSTTMRIIVLFLIFLCSISIFADETLCPCDEYDVEIPHISLAREFAQIGQASLSSVARDANRRELQRLQLIEIERLIEESIPRQCQESVRERLEQRGFLVTLTLQGGGARTTRPEHIPMNLGQMAIYQGLLASTGRLYVADRCFEEAESIAEQCEAMTVSGEQCQGNIRARASGECNERRMTEYERIRDTQILNGSEEDFLAGAREILGDELYTGFSSDLNAARLLRRFLQLINSFDGDVDAFFRRVEELRGLSFEDKIIMGSFLGGLLLSNYDDTRRGSGPNSEGVVPIADMLSVARARLSGTAGSSGVCRDISLLQAQFLHSLGLEHAYTVSSPTLQGVGHVYVVAQDPSDPTRVVRFNYSDAEIRDALILGTDSLQLEPSGHLSASNVATRVHGRDGRTILSVQGEQALLLATISGRLPNDPLSRPVPLSTTASVQLTSVGTELRSGFGQTRQGVSMYGIDLQQSYGGEHLPGVIGVTYARAQSPMNEQDLNIILLHIEQAISSGTIDLNNEGLQAEFSAVLNALGTAQFLSEGGPIGLDGDATLALRASLSHGQEGDRTQGTVRAEVQLETGTREIQDSSVRQYRPILNHALFSATERVRLGRTPEGRRYLLASLIVLVNKLGVRARAQLGISGDHLTVAITGEGRLVGFRSAEVPLWLPGSARRVGGTVQVTPRTSGDTNISLGVEGSTTLEDLANRGMRGQDFAVQGQVQITFGR